MTPRRFGNGTVRWGEATDEPAREDARPTNSVDVYHYRRFASFDMERGFH
jgi:hypothetical protein